MLNFHVSGLWLNTRPSLWKIWKDQIENKVTKVNVQKLLDHVELIFWLCYISSLLELLHMQIKYAQGIYYFVEVIRCANMNCMSSTTLLNASLGMKLLMHSMTSWLENMMGCLWFSLNPPTIDDD